MTREEFEQLSAEEHEEYYKLYYSAYYLNREGGHEEAAKLSRMQMDTVLIFGKVSPERQAVIEKQVEVRLNTIQAWLDEVWQPMYAEGRRPSA